MERERLLLPALRAMQASRLRSLAFAAPRDRDGRGELLLPALRAMQASRLRSLAFAAPRDRDGRGELLLPALRAMQASRLRSLNSELDWINQRALSRLAGAIISL